MVCSSRSGYIPRTLGVLIWPSMMTCATCTPCGPNSRAMDWASALKPNLPTASAENRAEPRNAAVAPVSRIVPRARDALLAARHERHREALASEALGNRRPETGTDAQDRGYPAVQVVLLSLTPQALPVGNSCVSRDSGYISMEYPGRSGGT